MSGMSGTKWKAPDPFYLSKAWRRLRARVLREHPTCEAEGCEARASHVDHIKPRRLFPELELARENLRALCVSCHNTISAQQYSPLGFDENGEPTSPLHPWNAGEEARVAFVGVKRAPEQWQHDTLRRALDGAPADVVRRAATDARRAAEVEDVVPLVVPPPARRPG